MKAKEKLPEILLQAANHAMPKSDVIAAAARLLPGLDDGDRRITSAGIPRWLHLLLGDIYRLRAGGYLAPHHHAEPDTWRFTAAGVIEATRFGAGLPSVFAATGRRTGESAWHRSSVLAVAANPGMILGDLHANPLRRTWVNSIFADDRSRLWQRLRTARRPDVVFEQADGTRTCVEVEPDGCAFVGIGQVSDYANLLRDELALRGERGDVRAVLVVRSAGRVVAAWRDLIGVTGVRVVGTN